MLSSKGPFVVSNPRFPRQADPHKCFHCLLIKALGKTKAFCKVRRRYFELKNNTGFFLLPAEPGQLLLHEMWQRLLQIQKHQWPVLWKGNELDRTLHIPQRKLCLHPGSRGTKGQLGELLIIQWGQHRGNMLAHEAGHPGWLETGLPMDFWENLLEKKHNR